MALCPAYQVFHPQAQKASVLGWKSVCVCGGGDLDPAPAQPGEISDLGCRPQHGRLLGSAQQLAPQG